eukprot:462560_1
MIFNILFIKQCNNKNNDTMVRQFPAYLSAFSSIIYYIDYVDDEVVDELSLMINMIYDAFASTLNKTRFKLYEAIVRLFVVLYIKGNIFNKLLEIIIYKGLIFSITTLEENMITAMRVMDTSTESGLRVRHCYEEFYFFWHGLLFLDSFKWNKGLNIDMEETNKYLYEMRSVLFNSIISNLIKILSQFNLKVKTNDDNININNMIMNNNNQHMELENANDMELFLNYT